VHPRIGVEREAPEEFRELRAAILLDEPVDRQKRLPICRRGAEPIHRLGPGRAAGECLEVREELDLRATITNQDGTTVLEGECWTYTLLPE
jgi:hypothetical protein